MNKIVNGVLEGNLDVFIIPNKGGLVSNWLGESTQKKLIRDINAIAELNGFEFDPEKDPLVQLWFCGMDCDNLIDHYCHVEDEDGNRYMFRANNLSHLPVSIFKDHQEGDTIELSFPASIEARGDEGQAKEITVKTHVTLKQLDYRYSRFGRFEEVLKQVV